MTKNLPATSDQHRFRDEQRQKCERELSRLQKLRASLAHFEENDQPAFSSWLHSFFGAELTRLRELYALQDRKYEFIKEVEREAINNQISFHKAYLKVLKRKQRKPVQKPADKQHHERHQAPVYEKSKQPSKPANSDIKERYRDLARQLHPDVNPNLDQRKKDLWHQVQEAYEKRDLGRLDQLASFSNLIEQKTADSETPEALKKMFTELRRSCREIEKAIMRVRQEPAWDFTNAVKERARLERVQVKVAIQIEMDLERLLATLEEFDDLVSSWQHAKS